jgi:hypothetical protein
MTRSRRSAMSQERGARFVTTAELQAEQFPWGAHPPASPRAASCG